MKATIWIFVLVLVSLLSRNRPGVWGRNKRQFDNNMMKVIQVCYTWYFATQMVPTRGLINSSRSPPHTRWTRGLSGNIKGSLMIRFSRIVMINSTKVNKTALPMWYDLLEMELRMDLRNQIRCFKTESICNKYKIIFQHLMKTLFSSGVLWIIESSLMT